MACYWTYDNESEIHIPGCRTIESNITQSVEDEEECPYCGDSVDLEDNASDNICVWKLTDNGWRSGCGQYSPHEHNNEDPCCEYCAEFVEIE